MRYETLDGLSIPKVGLGTWGIGGHSSPEPARDAESLAALRSALELGYTHFDTAEMYAAGHAEDVIGRAVRESRIPRESLFIVSKVLPEHLEYHAVLKACEGSLRRLGMDYLDVYLIHQPTPGMDLPQTFRALNELVAAGKVRRLGVSNFDLRQLKASEELSETGILTNQVLYSLTERGYVADGLLAYCQQNDILLTAYSPVDEGRFRGGKKVDVIARAHGITPQQVALAWLVMQPRVITIPMSMSPVHQRQNLEAADVLLSEAEMAQLERSG